MKNVFGESGDEAQDRRIQELKDKYLNTDDPFSRPFRKLFEDRLPQILARLSAPQRCLPAAFRETAALVCYHIFAEGVVAESAYFGFQKALTKAPWTRGMMMRGLFVMNCLANMPSVIGIVGAVHREHPGEFPFELDRQQLAREGVKQFWSHLKGVLFGKNAAAT